MGREVVIGNERNCCCFEGKEAWEEEHHNWVVGVVDSSDLFDETYCEKVWHDYHHHHHQDLVLLLVASSWA